MSAIFLNKSKLISDVKTKIVHCASVSVVIGIVAVM